MKAKLSLIIAPALLTFALIGGAIFDANMRGARADDYSPYARRLAPAFFANLGTPANGSVRYCSDCAATSPCTGSGSGANASRVNGAWNCGDGGSGSSLPVTDTTAVAKGSADATKQFRFEVDGFTTGTTRVLTPPNADGTIATLENAQTFTAAQTIARGSVSSGSALSVTSTWTGGGTFPGAIFANVTDSSSASGSLLMDLQVGGSSKFKVAKDGTVTAAVVQDGTQGSILNSSGLVLAAGYGITWAGRLKLASPASGDFKVTDSGGSTLANAIVAKVCYDASKTICDWSGSSSPEGAVTASVSSTYRRTDGSAGTSFYVKESGTGNTGWAAK